jgi:fumarate reductase subunit D
VRALSGHRSHPTYWAFVLHRLSGLALAIFLPIHLYVLSLVIGEGSQFDAFIAWTAHPLVKFAETGLVVLLALHMAGGLRLLAVEFLPWQDRQKTFAAIAGGIAVAAGLLYLLNLI